MNWILCSTAVLIVTVVIQVQSLNFKSTNSEAAQNANLFASDIFKAVALEKLNENVVISPAAIQISMALAFYGARGKTAIEMQAGLRLGSANPEQVVRRFAEFQHTFARDNYVRLVNKIFVNDNLEFNGKFNEIAHRNFESSVEKADFQAPRTADSINKLIEEKTNNMINNVIESDELADLTKGVIVNGISFSAPWKNAFKADKTRKRSFLAEGREDVQMDTMWTLNNFKYGELKKLDAKVVELPYQNTDFAMLILLPNKNEGLRNLEQTLAGKNLVDLVKKELSLQKVEVFLPKFSVSSGVELQEPLKKLGVTTMFTGEGDFGDQYYINGARYNAHVEVDEKGAEEPLKPGGTKELLSRIKKLDANHPFVFAIRYKDSIIFMGHIANNAYD